MVRPIRMDVDGEPVIYYEGRQYTIDSLFELVMVLDTKGDLPKEHQRLKQLYEQQQTVIEAYQRRYALEG